MDDRFIGLADALLTERVRFVVIGVAGLNYYGQSAGLLFTTEDRDLFLPPDPADCLRAWRRMIDLGATEYAGWEFPEHAYQGKEAVTLVAARSTVLKRSPDLSPFFRSAKEIENGA